MKIFLLFVFFFGSKTFGNEKKDIIDQLPEIARVSPLDTLKNVKNDSNSKDQKDVKNKFFVRKFAMSGMIFFGGMAFITQKNADMNYNKYLKSGDIVEQKQAWKTTKDLDRLSGFLAIGSQICIQIIFYTYLND
tara:strand:- start:523 stop:924 length:402 start_codon:yes stop_codon:yes gene_type:complete